MSMANYRFTEDEAPVGRQLYVIPTGKWRTHRPAVNERTCIMCGMCAVYCPTGSINTLDGGWEFDPGYCKGCAICVRECPVDALQMVREVAEDR